MGLSVDSASQQGWGYTHKPEVLAEIARRDAKFAADNAYTIARLKAQYESLARADPRKLATSRQIPCRHCHGVGHKHQYRINEWDQALTDHKKAMARAKTPKVKLDPLGGIGYTKKLPPHPDCPVCDGEGINEPYIPDLAQLDPDTAQLYGGIKHTSRGLEIIVIDKAQAMMQLGKHLGFTQEEFKVPEGVRFIVEGAPVKRKPR